MEPSKFLETDILCKVVGFNENKIQSVHSTSIILNDSGWISSIINLFIFGFGAFRLYLIRGGTLISKSFIISTTIVANVTSKAFTKAIFYPGNIENHIASWKKILGQNNSTFEIDIVGDFKTLDKLTVITTSYSSNGSEDWSDKLLNSVIYVLKPLLEPVSVSYSNELLAKQIYGVSVFLFILSVLILILLIAFIIQILILIYSDKIMSFFSNKYIRWYIQFNKKILGIEVCFLGISLVYFMYQLSYGIHFIATHPITIT